MKNPELETLLDPHLVRCKLPELDKNELLSELVRLASDRLPGIEAGELHYVIAEREGMGPLPLGKGIAFCHARTDRVPGLCIAICTCPGGVIDAMPPDDKPVRVGLLFLIPKGYSDLYTWALSTLLRRLTRPEVMQGVLETEDPEEVVRILCAAAG